MSSKHSLEDSQTDKILNRVSKSNRSIALVVYSGILLGFLGFLFAKEIGLNKRRLGYWLDTNQAAIEQHLFLDNKLGLESIKDAALSDIALNNNIHIAIYDSDNKLIFGQRILKYLFVEITRELHFLDRNLGSITVGTPINLGVITPTFTAFVLVFILIAFLFLRTSRVSRATLNRLVMVPLSSLDKQLSSAVASHELTGRVFAIPPESGVEFTRLVSTLNSLTSVVETLQKEAELRSKAAAEVTMARQVAHDIRSPLAALQMLSRDLGSMPEDQRIVLRQSIARISDIANDLLSKRANKGSGPETSHSPASSLTLEPELLSSILDSIVSEKRIQYRSHIGIEIQALLGPQSYGIFANINANEFKRVISNLINNAAEALPQNRGMITLELKLSSEGDRSQALLMIKDNGLGIPLEVLSRLGEEGFSHGKESNDQSGSGLGVFHARKIMESFGGSLHFDSVQAHQGAHHGTTVILKIPTVSAPAWFANQVKVNDHLVIADDDASIHQIWDGRAQSLGFNKESIIHLSTPNQVISWFNSESEGKSATLLIDYEFLGHQLNGLDVVQKITSPPLNTYLVTSRYEESHVRDRVCQLGIQMVPKGLAPYVPLAASGQRQDSLSAKPAQAPDFVLIDDDKLIGDLWVKIASQKAKKALSFTTPEDFYAIMDSIPKHTPIYVDQSLQNNVMGVDVTKKLFQEYGFTQLFLATGYDPSEFKNIPWIKGVQDKMPPV